MVAAVLLCAISAVQQILIIIMKLYESLLITFILPAKSTNCARFAAFDFCSWSKYLVKTRCVARTFTFGSCLCAYVVHVTDHTLISLSLDDILARSSSFTGLNFECCQSLAPEIRAMQTGTDMMFAAAAADDERQAVVHQPQRQ